MNRFKTALDCQDAVNFTALVNTALLPACKQILDEGGDSNAVTSDAAVILIMDKLHDLMERPGGIGFSRAYEECKRRCEE